MTIDDYTGQMGHVAPLNSTAAIVMRQNSTKSPGLTITLSCGVTSTVGGQGLVVRRTQTSGTSGGTELFVTEYDGVRGFVHTEAITSGTTAVAISESQSGSMIFVPGNGDGYTMTLPSPTQGLCYEFYQTSSGNSGLVTISAPTAGQMVVYGDSAANSWVFGKATTASGTQVGNSVRFIADGSQWLVIPQPGYTSATPTSATMTEVAFIT